jgi:methylated-DNA-[protein]-cysteine S-methyltransferase
VAVTRVAYTVDGWGEGELWFEGPVVVWHELPHPRAKSVSSSSPHPGGASTRRPLGATLSRKSARVSDETAPIARRVIHKVERYFAGEAVDFADVRVALEDLTRFQSAVASALRRVPYGDVVSYGELAKSAGYPNAQRAAGTFCAHNRFPLILPCHRVVGASGLGSYGSLGTDYKRRLLELEGVTL